MNGRSTMHVQSHYPPTAVHSVARHAQNCDALTDLAIRAKAGDDDAKAELLNAAHNKVLGYVRRRWNALAGMEPEDVAQDIVLKAMIGLSGFDPNKNRFDNWLSRIALNHCTDICRRPSTQEHVGGSDELREVPFPGSERAVPLAILLGAETRAVLDRAIGALTDAQFEALELDREGVKGKDIATRLGISPSAVSIRLSQAKNTLAAAMRLHYGDPGQHEQAFTGRPTRDKPASPSRSVTIQTKDGDPLADLALRAKDGDEAATAQLLDQVRKQALGCIAHRCTEIPGIDPEDVAQDVVLTVLRRLPSFDPTKRRFSIWLSQITKNRWTNISRRYPSQGGMGGSNALHEILLAESHQVPPFHDLLQGEARVVLEQAIATLTAMELEVLELHQEGMRGVEIAERLGTQPKTVSVRLTSARTILAAAMKRHCQDPLRHTSRVI